MDKRELKRGDLIRIGDTRYIMAVLVNNSKERCLFAWDFEAWAEGYYDAYLGITEDWGYGILPIDKAVKEGNINETPELLPSVCDGYNGEPSATLVEHIWP